tara:strand:+ start:4287 stop:6230 length:1944 start_codon:yes stop_codon:yes gene_type:complete
LKKIKTTISVITVCKNAEKYIEETLLSVMNQKKTKANFDIQYIIFDGNSSDNTNKIIERYKTQYPEIEHYIENDEGLYDGLIKGFNKVKGDIVSYINAGDFYYKNAFNNAINLFENFNNIKWLTGAKVIYNEDSEVIKYSVPYIYRRNLIRSGAYGRNLPFIQQESTFWRKELLKLVDYEFLKKLKKSGDMYLWYSFAKDHELFIVDSYLSGFKFHENQLTFKETGNTDIYLEEASKFLNKKKLKDYFQIALDSFFWFLSKYQSQVFNYFNKNQIIYDIYTKSWLLDDKLKKKIICWASEINTNQGEGKLGHNFIKYLTLTTQSHVHVRSLDNSMSISSGKLEKSKKKLYAIKTNLNFFEKYIGPYVGVIYLWIAFILRKKTIYANFLPLWNFPLFFLLPPKTILGPITGTTKIETNNLVEKTIRKYLMPICFKISIMILNLRKQKTLFATENLKDVVETKLKNSIFFNFSLSEIDQETFANPIKFSEREYDFCIYYRKYPTKNNEFFENIIKKLLELDQKIVVVGDKFENVNSNNLIFKGLIDNKELNKVLSNTKFSIVSDETLFSFFAIDCMKHNINIFCNKKNYNLDEKFNHISSAFHKINFEDIDLSIKLIKEKFVTVNEISFFDVKNITNSYEKYFESINVD